MTIYFNEVPTVCTARTLTGWDIPNIRSDTNPKLKVNAELNLVNELMKTRTGSLNKEFLSDFAMLQVIITNEQVEKYEVDRFLDKIGFRMEREFKKTNPDQRHKETGSLFLWTATPDDYEHGLKAYHKELTDLKEKIDPPKKPDPKRLAFPDLRLKPMIEAGHLQPNLKLDNPLNEVMKCTSTVLRRFIKIKYGFDPQERSGNGEDWIKMTGRRLRKLHEDWKNELI